MAKYAYYNEFDPNAAQWLRELIKLGEIAPGEVDERSIVDVKADDVRGFSQLHFFAGIGGWSRALRLAGWADNRPCFTGSPPCQPFSVAGKQKGIKDERHLWPVFFDIIKEIKPPVVFGEQVASAEIIGSELEASFVEAVQCGDYARANKLSKQIFSQPNFNEHPRWIDNLQSDLERENYAMRFTVLGAHSAGAPHIRQRIFFAAERRMENADKSVSEQFARPRTGSGEASGSGAFNKFNRSSPVIGMGNTIIEGLEGHCRDGDGSHEPGRINQESSRSASETSGDGWLADTSDNGCIAADGLREAVEPSEQAGAQNFGESAGSGDDSGMDISKVADRGSVRNAEKPSASSQDRRSGDFGRLAEPDSSRREPGERNNQAAGHRDTVAAESVDDRPGSANALDGFWSAPDWLYCRDGKWRPVESSIFRIFNGLSDDVVRGCSICPACHPLSKDQEARIMRLKGYGNSINPELAAKFIKAYVEEK